MNKTYREITIAKWNNEDISGVLRLNGFRGHIISTSIPTNMGQEVEGTFYSKSFLTDIDGKRITIFHEDQFSRNLHTFGSDGGFSNVRCSAVWIIKDAFIDTISFCSFDHPNLSRFLDEEVAKLNLPKKSGSIWAPKPIDVEKVEAANNTDKPISYFYDFNITLRDQKITNNCEIRCFLKNEKDPAKYKYRLTGIYKFLSLITYRGDYFDSEAIEIQFYSKVQTPDQTYHQKGYLNNENPREPASFGAVFPLYTPEQTIRLLNFIFINRDNYIHAINKLYQALRPNNNSENIIDCLTKAVEFCGIETERRLEDKLGYLFEKLKSEIILPLKFHSSSAHNIAIYRHAHSHANDMKTKDGKWKEYMNDIHENLHSYIGLVSLSVIHYIATYRHPMRRSNYAKS